MIFSCGQKKKNKKNTNKISGLVFIYAVFSPFHYLHLSGTGPHRSSSASHQKNEKTLRLPTTVKKNLSVSSSHSFGRLLLLPSLSLSPSLFFSNGLRYQASTDSDSDWPHRYKTSVLFFLFAVSSLFFFFFLSRFCPMVFSYV